LIRVSIAFDEYPSETSWDIHEIRPVDSDDIDDYAIKSNKVENVDDAALCLTEGKWQFTIYDTVGDGLCCRWGEGHYNVTLYDEVIVQGSNHTHGETAIFDIPFNKTAVVTMSNPPPPYPSPFPTTPAPSPGLI